MLDAFKRPETMNHPGTQTPEPVAIVIIGATGDLSQRLLFPALYRLFSEGAIAGSLAIVGMSRRGMTHEQFRTFVREGVQRDVAIDAASWGRFGRGWSGAAAEGWRGWGPAVSPCQLSCDSLARLP